MEKEAQDAAVRGASHVVAYVLMHRPHFIIAAPPVERAQYLLSAIIFLIEQVAFLGALTREMHSAPLDAHRKR